MMVKILKLTLVAIILILSSTLSATPFIDGLIIFNKDLSPYRSPTERQLIHETPSKIQTGLTQIGVTTKHWSFWNQIVTQEERGFFGYHSTKQKARIFHDIIKMVFEEILELEIKKDFYFLRIPFDPELQEFNGAREYVARYPDLYDADPPRRNQVVAVNYTLFGNYTDFGQCSACYFTKNHSAFQIPYEGRLAFLFNELGIPTTTIADLFRVASHIEQFETGVIYQLFDTSHHLPNLKNAYEVVDFICYPAGYAGYYDFQTSAPFSDIFQSVFPRSFDKNLGQIRLVMNTATPLNPYSTLTIRRYDTIDPEIIKKYEKNLREKIRNFPRDPQKVDSYKQKLKEIWDVQN